MRISDWSSDVCSSDLTSTSGPPGPSGSMAVMVDGRVVVIPACRKIKKVNSTVLLTSPASGPTLSSWISTSRSEEHTSELQSLMRISYAVFCLQKNKQRMIINNHLRYTTTHNLTIS